MISYTSYSYMHYLLQHVLFINTCTFDFNIYYLLQYTVNACTVHCYMKYFCMQYLLIHMIFITGLFITAGVFSAAYTYNIYNLFWYAFSFNLLYSLHWYKCYLSLHTLLLTLYTYLHLSSVKLTQPRYSTTSGTSNFILSIGT